MEVRAADGLSAHPHHASSHYHPHIVGQVNELVSKLAPFAQIIITVILVILFLIRYFIFEAFLMKKCYGDKYTQLSDINRRGFINHHIAGAAKIIMIIVASYPFVDVLFGKGTVHSPYGGSKVATLGDVLLVINQLFIAMYLFELSYRAKLSPIAIAHHIGAIIIAQASVAISINWAHERDAVLEFELCLVWGCFDVVAEFWPHVAIILYRVYPNRHSFLAKVFLLSGISTFAGTIVETATVMWLFGSSWNKWAISFKIVTPLLHVIFSMAQIWGAWNFYCMWQRQKRLMHEKDLNKEPERGLQSQGSEATRIGSQPKVERSD